MASQPLSQGDPLEHEADGSALIASATVRRVCGSGSNAVVLLCSFPQLRDDLWVPEEEEGRGLDAVERGDRIPRGRKIAVKISSHFWDTNAKRLLDCERTTLNHLPQHPNVIRVWSRFKAAIPQHFVQYLTPDMAMAAADVDAGYTTQVFCMDYHPLTLDNFRAVLPTPMPWHFLWRIARDLITVVVHMERHRVAHLDLKLDNILVAYDGRCVLTDFGISRVFPDSAMALEYSQPFDLLMNRLVLSPEVLLAHDESKRVWEEAEAATAAVDSGSHEGVPPPSEAHRQAAAALAIAGADAASPLKGGILRHRGAYYDKQDPARRQPQHPGATATATAAAQGKPSGATISVQHRSGAPAALHQQHQQRRQDAHTAASGDRAAAQQPQPFAMPFADQNVWAVGIALYELAAGFMHEPSYPETGGGVFEGLYSLSAIPPLPVPALRRHGRPLPPLPSLRSGTTGGVFGAPESGAGAMPQPHAAGRSRGSTAPAIVLASGAGAAGVDTPSRSPPRLAPMASPVHGYSASGFAAAGDELSTAAGAPEGVAAASAPQHGFRADACGWLHYEPPPTSSATGRAAWDLCASTVAAPPTASEAGQQQAPGSPDATAATAPAVSPGAAPAGAALTRAPVTGSCYPREFASLLLSMMHADPRQRIGAVEALAAIERLRPRYCDVSPGVHSLAAAPSVPAAAPAAAGGGTAAAAAAPVTPGSGSLQSRLARAGSLGDPIDAVPGADAAAGGPNAASAAASAPADAGVFVEVQVAPDVWLPVRVDAPDVTVAVSGDAYTFRPATLAELEDHSVMPVFLRHTSGAGRLMLIDSSLSVETAVTAWSICPRAVHILPPDRQGLVAPPPTPAAGAAASGVGAAGVARSTSLRAGRASRANTLTSRKSLRLLSGSGGGPTGPSRSRAAPHPPASAAAGGVSTPPSRASKAFLGGNPRHKHLLSAAAADGFGDGSAAGGSGSGALSPGRDALPAGAKSPLSPAMRPHAFTGVGSKPAPPAGGGLPPPAAAVVTLGPAAVGASMLRPTGLNSRLGAGSAAVGSGGGSSSLTAPEDSGSRPSVAALLAKFSGGQQAPARPSGFGSGEDGSSRRGSSTFGASRGASGPLDRRTSITGLGRPLADAAGWPASGVPHTAATTAVSSSSSGPAAADAAASGAAPTTPSAQQSHAKVIRGSSSGGLTGTDGDDGALEIGVEDDSSTSGADDSDAALDHEHDGGSGSDGDDGASDSEGEDGAAADDDDEEAAAQAAAAREATRHAEEDAACYDHYPHVQARSLSSVGLPMAGFAGAAASAAATPGGDAASPVFAASDATFAGVGTTTPARSPVFGGFAGLSSAASRFSLGSAATLATGAAAAGAVAAAELLRDDDSIADAVLGCRLYAGGCEINKAAAIRSILTYFPESDPWTACYALQPRSPAAAQLAGSADAAASTGAPPAGRTIVARIHAVVLDLIPAVADTVAASADYFLQLAADAVAFNERCQGEARALQQQQQAGQQSGRVNGASPSPAEHSSASAPAASARALVDARRKDGAASSRGAPSGHLITSWLPTAATSPTGTLGGLSLPAASPFASAGPSRPLSAASRSDSTASGPLGALDGWLTRPLTGPWSSPDLTLPRELLRAKAARILGDAAGGASHNDHGSSRGPSAAVGSAGPLALLDAAVSSDGQAAADAVLRWLRHRSANGVTSPGRLSPRQGVHSDRSMGVAMGSSGVRASSYGASSSSVHGRPHSSSGGSASEGAAVDAAMQARSTVAECVRTLPQQASYMQHAVLYRCLLALTGLCNTALREAVPDFPFYACAAATVAVHTQAAHRHESAAASIGLLRNVSCTDNAETARRIVAAGAIQAVCGLFAGPWQVPATVQEAATQLFASATVDAVAGGAGASAVHSDGASASPEVLLLTPTRGGQSSASAAADDERLGFSAVRRLRARDDAGNYPPGGSARSLLDAAAAAPVQQACPGATGAVAEPFSVFAERVHGDDPRLAEDSILSISNLVRFGESHRLRAQAGAVRQVLRYPMAALCSACWRGPLAGLG